ncbi:hypothetical protein VTK73DRAFT_6506 [Phialemonium thermophilum]|uniref:Uncharacterized protein n=1 Tax=Phialemonium thermophilum TaxID=223376 RepID=A0ABR3WJ38_9PEZI
MSREGSNLPSRAQSPIAIGDIDDGADTAVPEIMRPMDLGGADKTSPHTKREDSFFVTQDVIDLTMDTDSEDDSEKKKTTPAISVLKSQGVKIKEEVADEEKSGSQLLKNIPAATEAGVVNERGESEERQIEQVTLTPAEQEALFKELEDVMGAAEPLRRKSGRSGLTSDERFKLTELNTKINWLRKTLSVGEGSDDKQEQVSEDISKERTKNDVQVNGSGGGDRIMSPTTSTHFLEDNDTAANLTGQPEQSQAPPQKQRRQVVKSAKEYWQKQYGAYGTTAEYINANNKRPGYSIDQEGPAKKSRRKKGNDKAEALAERLRRFLRDDDPVMARASLGEINPSASITAHTKKKQRQQIKDYIDSMADRKKDVASDRRAIVEANGMKTALYHHQLIGVRWMLGREFAPGGPYGGILADQMGLGKTLEMIGTICSNKPSEEDVAANRKITLIVAPAAAISQWKKEIEIHCSWEPLVFHYRSKQDIGRNMWENAHIILVSYHEVANAYPSENELKRLAGQDLNDEQWAKQFDNVLGELFSTEFFRVVLDEAHAIRNLRTRTSKACMHLTSKYRWVLSGTPLINSVDELYPLMRFIGAHWADDYKDFKEKFGNLDDDTVIQRLERIIPMIMLRRRVDDTFLGQPILEIPQTHPVKHLWLDLSVEERLIYRRLEDLFTSNMKSHIRTGDFSERLRTYYAYLTALRQAVAHPFLLEGVMKRHFTGEDLTWLRNELQNQGGKIPLHAQLSNWVEVTYVDKNGERQFGKGPFGYLFDMDAELQSVEEFSKNRAVICRKCYEVAVQPHGLECGHAFCLECLQIHYNSIPENEDGDKIVKCPSCRFQQEGPPVPLPTPDPQQSEQKQRAPVGDNTDGEKLVVDKLTKVFGPLLGKTGGKKQKRKAGKKKKQKTKREIGDDELCFQPAVNGPCAWMHEYDRLWPRRPLVPSAKQLTVKPVFVEWRQLAAIIGRMLYEEKIKFVYYFANANTAKRNEALLAFQETEDYKIMVASVKAGGVALNLTCANRCILVDQWWNSAQERQAFGRIHRIGQKKPTHFVKILAKGTIDERLVDLQAKKDYSIKATLMDEEFSRKDDESEKPKLTAEEVVRLIGNDSECLETLSPRTASREDEAGIFNSRTDSDDEGDVDVNDDESEKTSTVVEG